MLAIRLVVARQWFLFRVSQGSTAVWLEDGRNGGGSQDMELSKHRCSNRSISIKRTKKLKKRQEQM